MPKPAFTKIFEKIYGLTEQNISKRSAVIHQEIALIFIVIAKGIIFNIELPMNDPTAEAMLRLSEQALVRGDFLSNNTIAGLQTLVGFRTKMHSFVPD